MALSLPEFTAFFLGTETSLGGDGIAGHAESDRG